MKKIIILSGLFIVLLSTTIISSANGLDMDKNIDQKAKTIQIEKDLQINKALIFKNGKVLIQLEEKVKISELRFIKIMNIKKELISIQNSSLINENLVCFQLNPEEAKKIDMIEFNKKRIAIQFYNGINTIYINKEKTKFIDCQRLKLVFTEPVDIGAVPNVVITSSGKKYLSQKLEYFKNDFNQYDYTTLVASYSDLPYNSIYRYIQTEDVKGFENTLMSKLSNQRELLISNGNPDIYPPKLIDVTIGSRTNINLNFLESSDLDVTETLKKDNYRVYETSTGKNVEIKSMKVKRKTEQSSLNQIELSVDPLDVKVNYSIEFKKIKDIYANEIPIEAINRVNVTFVDYNEKGPMASTVETLSSSLLRVYFNKEVFVPEFFELSNIALSNDLKPISIKKDPNISNAVLIKTTEHQTTKLSVLRISGIEDKYGNESLLSYGTMYYHPNLYGNKLLEIAMLENQNIKNQNVVTLTFSEPVEETQMCNRENYNIKGLEILYIYKVSDKQVRLVTSVQKRGEVYSVYVKNLIGIYESNIQYSTYRDFSGVSLDE